MDKIKKISYILYMSYGDRKITFPFSISDNENVEDVVTNILMVNSFLNFVSLEKVVVSEVEIGAALV